MSVQEGARNDARPTRYRKQSRREVLPGLWQENRSVQQIGEAHHLCRAQLFNRRWHELDSFYGRGC